MSTFSWRPYRDDDDYLAMRRFLQDAWQISGLDGGHNHVGDLTWRRYMYTPDVRRPEDEVALWFADDGTLAGFAWYLPKWSETEIEIDPRLVGTAGYDGLAGEMIAWAARKRDEHADAPNPLTIAAFGIDTPFVRALLARGHIRNEDPPMRFHRRSLLGELPKPALPEGFSIRAMTDDADLLDRVAIHREVWAPSKITIEGYRQLRSKFGYDANLDLAAVAPAGRLAAYLICWHDEVNHTGEFEPVGAREEFRGKGLTKAVIYEALRRLKALGCHTAFVYTDEGREPATQLYRSAGFELVNHWYYYSPASGS